MTLSINRGAHLSAGVPSARAWLIVLRLSGDTMSLPAAKLFFSFCCSSAMFCCSFWMPRNCLYLTSSLRRTEARSIPIIKAHHSSDMPDWQIFLKTGVT